MGTEVLTPQDFFYHRFRPSPPAFHRRKTYFYNPRQNNSGHKRPVQPRPDRYEQKKKPQQPQPQPQQKHEQQHHQLVLSRRTSSANELQSQVGRITILRRGQSLDRIDATRMKRDLSNTTNGTLVRKKCMGEDDVYAGSAFFVSPSPSSLPLPSFFNTSTNTNTNNSGSNMDNDSATRDLRRLLRLD